MKTPRTLFTAVFIVLLFILQHGCDTKNIGVLTPNWITLVIQSPTDGQKIVIGTQFEMKFLITYAKGPVSIDITLPYPTGQINNAPISESHGVYSYIWDTQNQFPGTYVYTVTARDTTIYTSIGTGQIVLLGGPAVRFTVSPSSGTTDTIFHFDASLSYDYVEIADVLQFRWDWESDGTWDTQYSTEKTANHQFTQAGTYNVKLEVKNSEGLTSKDSVSVVVSDLGGNTPPIAVFSAYPTSGNTLTEFSFDAIECSDNEDPTNVLQLRWDWESDGIWDTPYSTEKTANHQFSQEGTYSVKLEVKDSEGLTDTYSVSVVVEDAGVNPGIPCPGNHTVTYLGKVYHTVSIGDQCWLKENLDVGNYISGNEFMSNNGTIEKFCYDDLVSNCDKYGGLYQWDEMMQYISTEGAQGICPTGWHIPTDEEWKQLEGAIDSLYDYPDAQWNGTDFRGSDCGFNLKTMNGWLDDGNGGDLYGFSASPAGWRGKSDYFFITEATSFWTSSQNAGIKAWVRQLYYNSDAIKRFNTDQTAAFSVRCIKD